MELQNANKFSCFRLVVMLCCTASSVRAEYTNFNYTELPPFSQLAHGLRSGPIFVIDQRTFFVTNLHYDGKGPDAHFWAGKGAAGPDEKGFLVTASNISEVTLPPYEGQDVYVRLPKNLTIKDVDYLGMWCIKYKHNFGYTDVPKNLSGIPEALGHHEYTKDGKYIARIPRCCTKDHAKTSKICTKSFSNSTQPLKIHWSNFTHFDDKPIQEVIYAPYLHHPKCDHNMFALDNLDVFYLLTKGLLLTDRGEIFTKDKFCIDNWHSIDDDDNDLGWHEAAFLCMTEEHLPEFMNVVFVVCIYVSSFFLIVTSSIFIFVRNARNTRGFNVVGYTVFMALSFICLATARMLRVTGTTCTVFGFVYQFLLVSSFTWLFCLTYETYHRVTHYDKPHIAKRFYIYGAFALGLPTLAVIVSLFINKSMPQQYGRPLLGYEPCWFRSDKRVIYYYLPIGISIVLNVIYAVLTNNAIKRADSLGSHLWKMGNTDKILKNVFRSCYCILIVMTLCWSAEIVSYFFETKSGFWLAIDIIDSLQGVFVFLIFIRHNPVSDILRRTFPRVFKPKNEELESSELAPMYYRRTLAPPPRHLEAMSKIKHADSMESVMNNS